VHDDAKVSVSLPFSYDVSESDSIRDNDGDGVENISFNAVQLVNRFLEVFSEQHMPIDIRESLLSDVFNDDLCVCSLKTSKILMATKAALLASFGKTKFHTASSARRLVLTFPQDSAYAPVSYCFDLHTPLTSPGLGDPSKDSALLYRCEHSKLTHIWGGVDKELLASLETLTLARIQDSEVWRLALAVITKQDCAPAAQHMHFHDYTNIEVIG
jgi:hypothetical protein